MWWLQKVLHIFLYLCTNKMHCQSPSRIGRNTFFVWHWRNCKFEVCTVSHIIIIVVIVVVVIRIVRRISNTCNYCTGGQLVTDRWIRATVKGCRVYSWKSPRDSQSGVFLNQRCRRSVCVSVEFFMPLLLPPLEWCWRQSGSLFLGSLCNVHVSMIYLLTWYPTNHLWKF